MTTLIPLPGNKWIEGESRHARFVVGDRFAWEGNHYQFLGRDNQRGLHARRLTDQKLCVFESSSEWSDPIKG